MECSLLRYSPDLSPIQNLWAKVNLIPITSKAHLVERLRSIWNDDVAIKDACIKLIDGMLRRIQQCIAAHGGVTKY